MEMETIPNPPKGTPKYKKKCALCGKYAIMNLQGVMCPACYKRVYGKKVKK